MALHYELAISTKFIETAELVKSEFNKLTYTLSNGQRAKIISAYISLRNKYIVHVSVEGMHYGLPDSNYELLTADIMAEVENLLLEELKKYPKLDFEYALFQSEIHDEFTDSSFIPDLISTYKEDKPFFHKRYSGFIASAETIEKYKLPMEFEVFYSNYKWINCKNKQY